MPKDVSLDSFSSPADDAESAEQVDGERGADAQDGEAASDAASKATDADKSAVEPAVSTYAWSPEGGECSACGDAAEKRWRDEGDLVCADCKSW